MINPLNPKNDRKSQIKEAYYRELKKGNIKERCFIGNLLEIDCIGNLIDRRLMNKIE